MHILREICKNSTIARPLHKLTKAKQKFISTDECYNALTSPPVLAYPQTGKQFILDTDARYESLRAVLSLKIDGQERVFSRFSYVDSDNDSAKSQPSSGRSSPVQDSNEILKSGSPVKLPPRPPPPVKLTAPPKRPPPPQVCIKQLHNS
ncbi:hypothetical protein TNCT_356901 [Trichonephila clavata]|uniref:Reverse transcriptase/retrotransposon-derived protein RNase H-like domain-containing protein n=1 Tax=Trichonephila clavata TaxID=2740835 RepID=A0A8X6HSC0_TRICU|nr:hypothetical protein TNCT_356901 [Trichonephila clavata]